MGLGTRLRDQRLRAQRKRPPNARALARSLEGSQRKGGGLPDGPLAGIDNRYFLVAAIPTADEKAQFHVIGTGAETDVAFKEPLTIPAQSEVTRTYELYVGPKGYTQLKHYQ